MNFFKKTYNELWKNRLKRLKNRYYWKNKELELKSTIQKNSHSLLWIWEFSKKAVLICFLFYVIVQIYAMFVMVKFEDFSYLGELITQTGQIVENCVFAYLVKAGVENIGKIFVSRKAKKEEEVIEEETESEDEIVG